MVAGSPTSVALANSPSTFVDAADLTAAVAALNLGTASTLAFDTDVLLAANSDVRVPTQKAIKAYADALITGVLTFKGSTDCSGNPNYPAGLKGDSYVVTVAGKIGGASGAAVDIGDFYVAIANNAGGTQAGVGASWIILEHNVAGALLAANNLSDVANAGTARSNLGLVIGTNVQAWNAQLDQIAALVTTAVGRNLLTSPSVMPLCLGPFNTGVVSTGTPAALIGGALTAGVGIIPSARTFTRAAICFQASTLVGTPSFTITFYKNANSGGAGRAFQFTFTTPTNGVGAMPTPQTGVTDVGAGTFNGSTDYLTAIMTITGGTSASLTGVTILLE